MIDIEQQLRVSLNRQAEATSAVHPDPWARYQVKARRHRNGRWARGGALGAGCAALAAAVALGVIPWPSVLPAVNVNPAAGRSELWSEPTRGSLAGDTSWLAGMRAAARSLDDGEGAWRIVDRDKIKIVYAGDVPGARTALLYVTVRHGVVSQAQAVWYQGPIGASPDKMQPGANDEPQDVELDCQGNSTTCSLVVVAPGYSRITTSLDAQYGVDGRVHRSWALAPGDDGVAVMSIPVADRTPPGRVHVTLGGKVLADRSMFLGGGSGSGLDSEVSAATVTAALAGARGPGVDLLTATEWVVEAEAAACLSPETTTVQIPWTGTVNGRPALLLRLTPKGGGSLFFAEHGDDSESRNDLRLLVPAKGAARRPIAWRMRAEGSDAAAAQAIVVTQRGTARADLVSGGTTVPIQLDDAGYASVPLAARQPALVKAYDKRGRLIAETPVPLLENDFNGLPGETPATRIVP